MSYYRTCPPCDCKKYPDMPAHELDAFKKAIQEPATRAQIIEILQGAGLLEMGISPEKKQSGE